MKTNKPFIGFEAEGPLKDMKTIFIPKGSLVGALEDKLNIIHSVPASCVYFGAGNKYGIVQEDFEIISKLIQMNYNVTIELTLAQLEELSIPENISDEVIWVLVFRTKNSNIRNISEIKFVDNHAVYWKRMHDEIYTDLNSRLYKQDTLL
jgi:hypothetical protein